MFINELRVILPLCKLILWYDRWGIVLNKTLAFNHHREQFTIIYLVMISKDTTGQNSKIFD